MRRAAGRGRRVRIAAALTPRPCCKRRAARRRWSRWRRAACSPRRSRPASACQTRRTWAPGR
eukprot:5476688-Prymnesium_polylepis.1